MRARAPPAPRTVPGRLTRPAAARCVIRAFRAEDRLSLARPQPDAGEREQGPGSAARKDLAREEEEDGIWLRSALGPAKRSPGPRAREGTTEPRSPGLRGRLPRPSLILAPNREAGRTRAAGRGQNPPRTLGTNPGRSGLGPPAAASSRRSIYTRGSGRTAESWGGGTTREAPPPACGPAPPAHAAHLGLQDPYSSRGSPPAAG